MSRPIIDIKLVISRLKAVFAFSTAINQRHFKFAYVVIYCMCRDSSHIVCTTHMLAGKSLKLYVQYVNRQNNEPKL